MRPVGCVPPGRIALELHAVGIVYSVEAFEITFSPYDEALP